MEHRKVYAKGFYDGLRASGINVHGAENMTPHKATMLINGLSSVARKVYDATPIRESWTVAQIKGELARTGISLYMKTVQGCIASLVSSGLVGEAERGIFRRRVKPEPDKPDNTNTLRMPSLTEISAAPAKQEPALPPAQEAPASQLSPIDILAGVLGRIDAAMENLKALKSDVEAAAIAIEEQFSDAKSKSVKFQQLQELLKSI